MSATGKKRASPGADEQKNLFDVQLSEADTQKLNDAKMEAFKASLVADFENYKRMKPVHEKRREVLKTIPKFWPITLMNSPQFAVYAQHMDDQKALTHLEDLYVTRSEEEPRAFTIEFHFKENPYFSDKVLIKEYKCVFPADAAAKDETPDEYGLKKSHLEFEYDDHLEPQTYSIQWKSDAVNLTKLHPRVVSDNDDENFTIGDAGSFFNFFTEKKSTIDLGVVIANEIFDDAIDYFTGEKGGDDLSDDEIIDEDDEEDDEDGDDAAEIDLEKPEPKKQKRQ